MIDTLPAGPGGGERGRRVEAVGQHGDRPGGLRVLVLLMFVGITIAVVSLGQAFQVGGSTWLGVLVGVGVATAAGGLLMRSTRDRG